MTKTSLLAWVAFAVIGCAHEIDPGVRATTPAPPVVANADFGSETFTGAGGVELYGRWWKPRGTIRGVLVVQHGLNDHGDRYAHLAETLVARGYAVYAMDLRGHGRSAGPRVEVDRFRDYLDDEAAWISRIRDKQPGAPIFVFGHSMGGLIMTIYAEEHPSGVSGVVLSAPALGLDAPPLQVAGIQLVAGLGSPGHMLPQRDADFTRDASVVADMGRDPLLTHRDGPTHTAVELVGAIELAWAHADELTVPLIVLHGSADKLTSPAATRDFVARAASADKRHVLIDGSWHDIAHDPARDLFEADIAAWLDAHTGGAAFGVEPEPAHLRGERAASAIGIEMGAMFAHETSALVATQLSFGSIWHGELAARIRDGVGLEVLPIGVAVRPWRAGQIAIAGGVRVGWPGSWSDISVPIRLTIDSPIGAAHAIASLTANLNASGASGADRALGDEHSSLEAMLAVRFGGDHDYWSRVSAGAGPYVGLTWSRTDHIDLWGVAFGIHLWGVD